MIGYILFFDDFLQGRRHRHYLIDTGTIAHPHYSPVPQQAIFFETHKDASDAARFLARPGRNPLSVMHTAIGSVEV